MKIKTILVILLAGTLLASCHGDLNIIQKSEVSANSMWQDEGDATSAMYGIINSELHSALVTFTGENIEPVFGQTV